MSQELNGQRWRKQTDKQTNKQMTIRTTIAKASVYGACARSCFKPFTEMISFHLDNIPKKK